MEQEEINYSKETKLCNFAHEKAGMEGIDRAKIDQTIYEATKDSEFYKRQQEKNLEIEEKVRSMKNSITQSLNKGSGYIREITEQINKKVSQIESERFLTET